MRTKKPQKGQCFRRLIRLAYFLGIIAVIGIIVVIFAMMIYSKSVGTYDSNLQISIAMHNSILYFEKSTAVAVGKYDAKCECGRGGPSFNAINNIVILKAINPTEFISNCWLRITSNPQTVFSGGIDYKCTGNCSIIDSGPDILSMGSSSFTAAGEYLYVNLMGIAAYSISITTLKGSITVHSANVSSTAYIKTEEGDIVYQSVNPYQLKVISSNKYYCIGTPDYHVDVADSCDVAAPLPPCTFTLSLCQTTPCSSVASPIVTLVGGGANTYANLIAGDDIPLGYNGQVYKTYKLLKPRFNPLTELSYDDGALRFNKNTESLFDMFFESYNNTNKGDSLFMFDFGNMFARSSSAFRVVTSTKSAYLFIKPWWISFFSFNLIIGSTYTLPVMLEPGFCPYRPLPTIYDITQAQHYINTRLADSNRKDDDTGVMYDPMRPVISTTPTKSKGYEDYSLEYTLYQIEMNNTIPILSMKDMGKRGTAALAVAISAILAFMVGFLAMGLLIYAIKLIFSSAANESVHIINYINKDIRNNRDSVFPAKDIEEFTLYETTEQGRGKGKVVKADETDLGKNSYLRSEGSDARSEGSSSDMSQASIDQFSSSNGLASQSSVTSVTYDSKKNKVNAQLRKQTAKPIVSVLRWLKGFPNQFEILDHIIAIIKKYFINSISEFLTYALVQFKEEDHFSYTQNDMKEIKSLYSQFCFVKTYPELDITGVECEKQLAKRGYKLNRRQDATTEVYRKLIMLDKPSSFEKTDNETSLDFFIRTMCKISVFEEDYVECEKFKKLYTKFCIDKREAEILITRSLMIEQYHIEIDQVEIIYLERIPDYCKKEDANNRRTFSKKIYKIDLDNVRQMLKESCVLHCKSKDYYERNKGSPFGYAWYIIDLLTILLHFLFVCVYTLAFLGIAYFFELMNGKYSIVEYQMRISTDDWIYSPWNIFFKIQYFVFGSFIIAIVSAVYLVISVYDLCMHNFSMKFPLATIRAFSRLNDLAFISRRLTLGVILRGIINFIEYLYIFLATAFLIMFIFLVMEWNILGAILNPVAYLTYATSAATFIAFIVAKYTYFKNLYSTAIECLNQLLYDDIKKNVIGVIKKLLQKHGVDYDKAMKAINDNTEMTMEDSVIANLTTTYVGRRAFAEGFSLKTLYKIIQCDQKAIEEFSSLQGIPVHMIEALLAKLNENYSSLEEAIIKLTKSSPFNMSEEIIKSIVNLATKHNENHISQIISDICLLFIKYFEDNNTIESSKFIEYEEIKKVFPQAINAIIALMDGKVDSFIDQLTTLSILLSESIKKKYLFANSIKSANSNLLLAKYDKGFPTYTIPKHVLYIMEMSKLLLFGSTTHIALKKERIRPTIYKILKSLTFMDDNLLEIIFFLFSSPLSKEKLKTGSIKLKSNSIINNTTLANYLSNSLKIPNFYSHVLMKMLFKTLDIDDTIVTQTMSHLASKFSDSNFIFIDDQFIHNIFRLYTLFRVKDPYKFLIKSAAKLNIDADNAKDIVTLMLSDEFLPDEVKENILENKLLIACSNALMLNKKDVSGFISLIKGNLDSPLVLGLCNSICQRNKIPLEYDAVMLAMLSLIVSKSSLVVIKAINLLHIKESKWILIAKRILHPKYLNMKDINNIIEADSPLYLHKDAVNVDNEMLFNVWIKQLKAYLQKRSSQAGTQHLQRILNWLNIDTMQINSYIIKDIIGIYEKHKKEEIDEMNAKIIATKDKQKIKDNVKEYEEKIFSSEQLKVFESFLTLKSIINRESTASILNAVKAFCSIMGLSEAYIMDIVNIISGSDNRQIKKSIKNLYKNSSLNSSSIHIYGLQVSSCIRSIYDSYEAIPYFSTHLRFPSFLFKYTLFPSTSNRVIELKDILQLIDLIDTDQDKHEESKKESLELTKKNEVKFLMGSLIVGSSVNLQHSLNELNVSPLYQKILSMFLSSSIPNLFAQMKSPDVNDTLLEHWKISDKVSNLVICLLTFFNGNSEEDTFIYDGETISAMKMLSNILKVPIECLQIFDIILFNRNKESLLAPIISLMQNNLNMPAYVIKGFSSIYNGQIMALENFAEALGLRDERILEVIIKYSNFANLKHIDDSLQSLNNHSFNYFFYELNIEKSMIIFLLKLSYNKFDTDEIVNIFRGYKICSDIDVDMLKAFISIAKGNSAIIEGNLKGSMDSIYKNESATTQIKIHCSKLFKELHVDPDIALLAIRLRQGDFKVIETQELKCMLPSKNIRDITMGIAGLLTHPLAYSYPLGKYPTLLPASLSFEGANHILCNALNINPILLRLASYDNKAYTYLCDRYNDNNANHISRTSLATMILSLGIGGYEAIFSLIGRSFMRSIKGAEEQVDINWIDSVYQIIANHSAEQVDKVEKGQKSKKQKKEEEVVEKKGDAPDLTQCGNSNVFSCDLETLMFNNPQMMAYNMFTSESSEGNDAGQKNKSHSRKRKNKGRNYFSKVSVKNENIRTLFNRYRHVMDIINNLFKNQFENCSSSSRIKIEYSWLNKGIREIKQNANDVIENKKPLDIWEEFTKVLKHISSQENRKMRPYQDVTVAHIIFYILIMSVKKMIVEKDIEKSDYYYRNFISELDLALYALEVIGLVDGKIEDEYRRINIMKFVSLATGIKISNALDYCIVSAYDKEYRTVYPTLTDKNATEEAKSNALRKLAQLLEFRVDNTLTINACNTAKFINSQMNPPSKTDSISNKIYQNINPYLPEFAEYWKNEEHSGQKFAYKEEQSPNLYSKSTATQKKNRFREHYAIKPKQFEDNPANAKVLTFERYICVEDNLQLLLELAVGKVVALKDYTESMIKQAYFKADSSIYIYQAFVRIISIMRLSYEYLQTRHKVALDNLESNQSLIEFCGMLNKDYKIDPSIAESLIMIAHGIDSPKYIESISSKLSIESELFMAVYLLSKGRLNEEDAKKYNDRLIKQLETNKVAVDGNIVNTIYNLHQRKLYDVKTLLCEKSSSLSVGITALFKCLKRIHKTKNNIRNAELKKILELDEALLGETASVQRVQQNSFISAVDTLCQLLFHVKFYKNGSYQGLTNLLQLLIGIIDKEVNLVMQALKYNYKTKGNPDVKNEEALQEEFQAIILLINNDYQIYKNFKLQETGFQKKINSLTEIAGEKLKFDQEKKEKLGKLFSLAFGYIYRNDALYESGITSIHPSIYSVCRILQPVSFYSTLVHPNSSSALQNPALVSDCFGAFSSLLLAVEDSLQSTKALKSYIDKGNQQIEVIIETEQEKQMNDNYYHRFNEYWEKVITKLEENKVDLKYDQKSRRQKKEAMKKYYIKNTIDSFELSINTLLLSLYQCLGKSAMLEEGKSLQSILLLNNILNSFVLGDLWHFISFANRNAEKNAPSSQESKAMQQCVSNLFLAFHGIESLSGKQLEDTSKAYEESVKSCAQTIADITKDKISQYNALHADDHDEVMKQYTSYVSSIVSGSKIDVIQSIIFLLLLTEEQNYDITKISEKTHFIIDFINNSKRESTFYGSNGNSQQLLASFRKLVSNVILYDFDEKKQMDTFTIDTTSCVDSIINIYFAPYKGIAPFIKRLITLLYNFSKEGSMIKSEKMKQSIVEEMSAIFYIDPKIVMGIVGLISGSFEAIGHFLAPIAKVDPNHWRKITDIMKNVKLTSDTYKNALKNSKSKSKTPILIVDSIKEIAKKVKEGIAGEKELFDLMDAEGDGNGIISLQEFKGMLAKLQIAVSEHRINEIFSKCKDDTSENEKDLNLQEFSKALEYVRDKDSSIGLALIGLSTSQLAITFSILIIFLLLLIAFILTGLNGFSQGGTFNSIINGSMPMLAGVAVGKNGPSFSRDSLKRKLQSLIDEIKRIMGKRKS